MADRIAIRGFYLVMDKMRNELLSNSNIKTCTFGDITDVDLGKQTTFPLAHILLDSVNNTQNILQFNFTILTMDQVDQKKDLEEDIFLGNNNLHDILNTQLAVINQMISKLRYGTLNEDGFELVGDSSSEPFYDRFENQLAGYSTNVSVQVINDINYC